MYCSECAKGLFKKAYDHQSPIRVIVVKGVRIWPMLYGMASSLLYVAGVATTAICPRVGGVRQPDNDAA
jgi:hypothetical protein